MRNIKKAALGLKAKPAMVGHLFPKEKNESKAGCFKFKFWTPRPSSIIILKNKDYDKLPF